jgi:hypothetical protein
MIQDVTTKSDGMWNFTLFFAIPQEVHRINKEHQQGTYEWHEVADHSQIMWAGGHGQNQ